MVYRLDVTKPLDDEVRRAAREQIGRALEEIESPRVDRETTVHQVRKRCKKLRALLRLVRDADAGLYRRENRAFRDIARALAAARDGEVLMQTFERIAEDAGPELGSQTRDRVRRPLAVFKNALVPGGDELEERLLEAGHSLRAADARVESWSFPELGFETIGRGVHRTYRRARRAMKTALASWDDEDLHEWRKRVKYDRYQVRLLLPLWEPMLDARRKALHRMTDLLGEDHDLAVLKRTLTDRGPVEGLTDVIGAIDARRTGIQAEMPALGRRLFAEKPGAFVGRLRTYHEAATASRG
jgi:CHAD domain-containing protein